MSGFVDELLARVTLSSVVESRVKWDDRKSRPAAGNYWACCPFHQEKTPSFHVNDQKGVYHCFGCHEGGNAITFVSKTQNVSNREAIQILADSLGMKMPNYESKDASAKDVNNTLYDICEKAGRHFQLVLEKHAGLVAKRYLAERGISAAAIKHFEIGFAANDRNDLTTHFLNQGISLELLKQAGLSVKPDNNETPYDRFRNRIMFPIRDVRGRMIAFGGRALSPNAKAKYLNSPETPIFKKSWCLYNHRAARTSMTKETNMVLAEGYMDVIALWEAGIKSCVAPLGTAITESQLLQLWKMKNEPILALDGDEAGRNAALRAAKLALPLIEPGKSLRFCFLPNGMDPDDYVRKNGSQAMLELLKNSADLHTQIWNSELGGRSLDTPERSAAFEASILATVKSISNEIVRKQYNQLFRNKLFELKRHPYNKSNNSFNKSKFTSPAPQTLNSRLATNNQSSNVAIQIREDQILGVCLTVPEIIGDNLQHLENLELSDTKRQEIMDCMIDEIHSKNKNPDDFRNQIINQCDGNQVNELLTSSRLQPLRHAALGNAVKNNKELLRKANLMLLEELYKIETNKGAKIEIEEAMRHTSNGLDDNSIKRINDAVLDRNQAMTGIDEATTADLKEMENGVMVDPKDLEKFQRIVDSVAQK